MYKYIFLLIFFSILCCSSTNDNEKPYADYKIYGFIKNSETKKSIPNIVINIEKKETKSDISGYYSMELKNERERARFIINVYDMDGTTDGYYKDKDESVDFSNEKFIGASGWYRGKAEKQVDIFMEEYKK